MKKINNRKELVDRNHPKIFKLLQMPKSILLPGRGGLQNEKNTKIQKNKNTEIQKYTTIILAGRGGAAGAKFRISLACPVGAVMNCADNTG